MASKIGIMGGSFDPIHNGHLYISQLAMEKLKLDKVVFVPTGSSPHKDSSLLADKKHRFKMTKLAIEDNNNFEVSDIEYKKDKISYTVDTLKKIKKSYGEKDELFFIIGFDTVEHLKSWKEPEEIGKLATIVAIARPNYYSETELYKVKEISEKLKIKIQIVHCTGVDISSTSIREEIKNYRTVKYLIPDEVYKYITKNRIYIDESSYELIKDIKFKLKEKLSEKRFRHSLNVADTCSRLAEHYNREVNSLYIAGLLHDYGKELSKKEKKDYCKLNNLSIDMYMEKDIDLAHGFISAHMAEKDFGIKDEDLLNGIRYHTIGRKVMSQVEKIIYIADCTEQDREFKGVNDIRKLSYEDIDLAMILALEIKIGFAENNNKEIHYNSIEALENLKNRSDKNGKN